MGSILQIFMVSKLNIWNLWKKIMKISVILRRSMDMMMDVAQISPLVALNVTKMPNPLMIVKSLIINLQVCLKNNLNGCNKYVKNVIIIYGCVLGNLWWFKVVTVWKDKVQFIFIARVLHRKSHNELESGRNGTTGVDAMTVVTIKLCSEIDNA